MTGKARRGVDPLEREMEDVLEPGRFVHDRACFSFVTVKGTCARHPTWRRSYMPGCPARGSSSSLARVTCAPWKRPSGSTPRSEASFDLFPPEAHGRRRRPAVRVSSPRGGVGPDPRRRVRLREELRFPLRRPAEAHASQTDAGAPTIRPFPHGRPVLLPEPLVRRASQQRRRTGSTIRTKASPAGHSRFWTRSWSRVG
jgi:hypothetical protein